MNESISQLIGWGVIKDEYLYAITGSLLIIMAFVVKCHFRIDPIDAGLIINEQAINLTSQYTDKVRD